MKPFLNYVVVSILLLLPAAGLQAQAAAKAMANPVIMKYYTPEQLQYFEQNDTAELNRIIYYFTASYIVEPVDCFECLPFDSAQFDVTRYEHLRKQDEVFIREFTKYGFRLTLLPVSQLPYTYEIHSVPLFDDGAGQK